MAEERKARTPDYVRKMPQYVEVKEICHLASTASKSATEVTDEESAARAAEALTTVSKAVKVGNKKRLEATEPYRNSTKAIDAEFKEMLSSLEGAEERLRKELADHRAKVKAEEEERQREYERELREHEKQEKERADREAAEAKKREDERRAAEEEAARKLEDPPPPPPEPEPPAEPPLAPPPPPPPPSTGVRKTSGGSVSGQTIWKFEIFDPAMVPADFKVIDEAAIRKAIKEGERSIAGLRIFPEERPLVR